MKLSHNPKRFLGRYGQYLAYVVDGEYVRNLSRQAEEFGNSGTHLDYPELVPSGEIWVEDDVPAGERHFLVAGALAELRAVEAGATKDEAYESGVALQRKMREIESGLPNHPERHNEKPPREIYVRRPGSLPGVAVWLVDGELVRDLFRTEFLEGGHGYVYPWIPNNEIWLEDGVHPSELPFILIHEYTELLDMRDRGTEYEVAHDRASAVEFKARVSGDSGDVLGRLHFEGDL